MVFLAWKLFFLGLQISKAFSDVTSEQSFNTIETKPYTNNGLSLNGFTNEMTTTASKSTALSPHVVNSSGSEGNRRHNGDAGDDEFIVPSTTEAARNVAAGGQAGRFTIPTTSTRKYFRTTPRRVSFVEDCDYLAHYCLKAYDTGILCARTMYYNYKTFKNYCLLDYVNCMERYEVWQVVHMGECFVIKPMTQYVVYPYDDDQFLDQYYIIEDQ